MNPGGLDLSGSVESDNSDSVSRVLLLAKSDLLEDLISRLASEEWELPHGPVSVLVESRSGEEELVGISFLLGGELNEWGPSVSNKVVNLLGDLLVGEVWQVGQALVLLLWLENLDASRHGGSRSVSDGSESRLSGVGWSGDDGLSGGHNNGVHGCCLLLTSVSLIRTSSTTNNNHELNLLGDLLVGEVWQVGQALVLLLWLENLMK
eukprot:CAMPEP_0182619718 /NCGR_PEP_ID=MMETSP1330-20130603/46241_1 /TAXON_ID=464278 /ORGANISM="Picochlorum sp., Strain RCC944" /LENGTH=206 /DNA_ID=CAMNT_0024839953 /DNA_START=160 /DNA_END=779 /DNA_ORIENTATION=-